MQRSYFPTYDVFFDGVLDPGHVDRGTPSRFCSHFADEHISYLLRSLGKTCSSQIDLQKIKPGHARSTEHKKKHGTRQKNIQTSIILLMEEMPLAPVEVGSLSHYLRAFTHIHW